MLSIDHIYFTYNETPVLVNLSLTIEPGKIHGILGSNGSGKTTLLNILAGRLAPDSGMVSWNSELLMHSRVAYLQTRPYFYPMITGREYLNLFVHQNSKFNIDTWNELFELPLSQLIEAYSSGMKKKLALMSVICLDRPIMLLDEPFNNLDVDANKLISGILKLLADKGKTILLTSHVIEILTGMANFIHLLQGAKISETVSRQQFESWKETYRLDEINAQINKAKDLL